MRNKQTRQATLVEIKPRVFDNDVQLAIRKEVAENYIRWRKFDWLYRIVYDDEIFLTPEQLLQFNQCVYDRVRTKQKFRLQKLNNRFDRSRPSLLWGAPTNKMIQFVMFWK